MSSDPIREIVVDDTDSQLSYKGNWKVDNGTILDNVGLYGPIFNETSHGASESGSSVNFSFVGTSITVYGTNQTLPDFGWECLIDNVRVIDMPKPPQVDNNWKLCGATSMREDTHSIAINVLSASNSGTLWIDYFRYTPLANATFNGDVTIHVPSSDPGIKYSAGWSTFGAFASVELAHYSQSLNANVEFTFVGTKLEWSGWYLKNFKHNPATATFTIDGSISGSFPLGNTPDTSFTLPNHIFFTTPDLERGRHTLVVTYNGGPGDAPTPLSLGYLTITGSSISTSIDSTTNSSQLPGSSATTISSNSPSSSSSTSPPIGAIVGSVVGGLAVIVLVLVLVILLRRQRRRRIGLKEEGSGLPPLEPFVSTAAASPALSSMLRSTKEYTSPSASASETFLLTPMHPMPASKGEPPNGLPPGYSLYA